MNQSRGAGDRLAGLPPDACPYQRPFPVDFDDCPAFINRSFVGFDLQHRPLGAVSSCRHLVVGNLDNRRYAQCEVGDAAARLEWATAFHEQRLERLRQVSQDFQEFLAPVLAQLYKAKGEQLRNRTDHAAAHRLREASARAMEGSEKWLEESGAKLEEAGLPVEACRTLIRLAFERLVAAVSIPVTYPISEEHLKEFPASVREFIRSGPVPGPDS